MTAVEYTIKLLSKSGFIDPLYMLPESKLWGMVEQAKAMEKEQHSNTWDDSRVEDKGDEYIGKQITFDQYYNETYSK